MRQDISFIIKQVIALFFKTLYVDNFIMLP